RTAAAARGPGSGRAARRCRAPHPGAGPPRRGTHRRRSPPAAVRAQRPSGLELSALKNPFATLSVMSDRDELAELVRKLAVVHGRVTLSSGKEAAYYVDLRRATLQHRAAALIGKLMRELTADWDYAVVGGLTLGADPVATAIMHAPGRPIDAFVVRKSAKTHGLQRLIEGSEVSGQRVLVVGDTSTTGNSTRTAVHGVQDAGGDVIGVATVVDRATGAAEAIEAEGLPYRSVLGLGDLGLG